jgi:hypothetical protein
VTGLYFHHITRTIPATSGESNAQTHLPPEAAARDERRLEVVRCSAVLGQG